MAGQMSLVPVERIERAILSIRGEKVMLDSDLVELYGVETKRLNEQVRRNLNRFPPDFILQLTLQEWESLRSQFATLKRGEHRKYLPHAFTEHGALMLANVLICRFAGWQPAPCPATQPLPITNRRHSRLPACATSPLSLRSHKNRCITEADLLR
jgi:hypothetical protein